MTRGYDVAIIGGGIAGATAAFHLAPDCSVLLLEREPQLALHTTGRSAAIFHEYLDGPLNTRLSVASRQFLTSPPEHLVDAPILTPQGVLMIGGPGQEAQVEADVAAARQLSDGTELLDRDAALELCPALRPESIGSAMWEPDSGSIDVMGLHQAYVRGARAAGTNIVRSRPLTALTRAAESWRLTTPTESFDADVVVNAAGAWGDEVGLMAGAEPVGLEPKRRTAFTVSTHHDTSGWPFLYAGTTPEPWYLKAETGGQLLCSPADETPSEPCDARHTELDVALAIDRINRATTLDIRSINTAWAGLRTFAPDRHPVIGWDDEVEGFFWMVGQGGTGIQTSPSAGALATALVLDTRLPPHLKAVGINPSDYAPRR